ncbi:MAG: hypothetical protein ACR2FP_07740 [Nocardioidaceae bacterium]
MSTRRRTPSSSRWPRSRAAREDFTGPGGTPMPLELWSDALLFEVPYSAPVAVRLVDAVEHYRASAPYFWRTLHPAQQKPE